MQDSSFNGAATVSNSSGCSGHGGSSEDTAPTTGSTNTKSKIDALRMSTSNSNGTGATGRSRMSSVTSSVTGGCLGPPKDGAHPKNKKGCGLSRTVLLRFLLMVSLLFAIAICTAVSFGVLRQAEHQVGLQTYESIAASALAGAQAITLRKAQGSQVMATLMAQIFPRAQDWPFIALEGYIPIAEKVAQLTSTTTQSLMVVLDLEDESTILQDFEQHTAQVYRDQGRPEDAGVNGFGFGLWKPDPKKSDNACEFQDCRLHDTSTEPPSNWHGHRRISTPLMLHNQPAASSLLYNLYSQENRGVHIDSMLDCVQRYQLQQDNETQSDIIDSMQGPSCAVITDILELKVRPGPAGLLFQPIYPAHDPSTIVAFATTSIHWEEVLTTTFPDFVSGLTCVVSTDTTSYTYEIREGVPHLIGPGDLHDDAYTRHAKYIHLNAGMETGALSSAVYTLTVYPTAEMFDSFSTNSPIAVSMGFFAVVAFCALVFVLYDYLMQSEAHHRDVILEMKRRFVRFISHEIRTPMNTLCMGIELLEAELKGTSKKISDSCPGNGQVKQEDVDLWYQVTRDIGQNAQTAVEILNDLLNFDKIESGTLTLETGPVCVWDLVERTVQQFQIQAVNRKVDLKFDMVKPRPVFLPEGEDVECGGCSDHLTVLGDNVKLGQVIRNLISNSLKFTPANGSIQVEAAHIPGGLPNAVPILLSKKGEGGEPIFSSKYPRAGSIQITVKDSGIGLTKEQLKLLFTEGVQFDANRLQHGGGSGLGLTIAKGIVEQHSGTLRADSEGQGHGTMFIIELPLYELSTEEMKSGRENKTVPCSQPPASPQTGTTTAGADKQHSTCPGKRILVAEDAVSSLKMLIRLLERAGHSCVGVENGQEAVNAIEEDIMDMQMKPGHVPFDTVLMDFEMPILKGPAATRKIRKLGFVGTVVGITGNILSEDVEFFKTHGADEVLPKPITMSRINAFWEQHDHGTRAPNN
ncbi:sensor kinase/phosphatase LuxQ [Seminavis robusta]|uniref:histidine kinase n=1 Tax=Seminavis robusta TaxID=568900 RepID=A0A9N8DV57_9STRA|nr:sensor kinase/phosphatase LuxQ [Seminavis robusta]|eukprot:Sro394_g133870.1 sensor kinase/phosphatase LuxQ (974) ;mRNA; f:43484-46771